MPALTHELIARTVPPPPPGPTAPKPDVMRLRAEMRVFLHGRDPRLGIWVFAFGGLMWNHHAARPDIVTPARLPGYARRYTLRDIYDRGTPAAPGLTLGLEEAPALACAGLLLHLPGPEVETHLWPIWHQEMGPGFHEPQWCDTVMHASRDAGGAPIRALTFISRHHHPLHAGEQPVGAIADILAEASGPNGSAASYLLDASETLRRHGMRDAMLESLEAEVLRRLTGSHPRRPSPSP